MYIYIYIHLHLYDRKPNQSTSRTRIPLNPLELCVRRQMQYCCLFVCSSFVSHMYYVLCIYVCLLDMFVVKCNIAVMLLMRIAKP